MKKIKTLSFEYASCPLSKPYDEGHPKANKFEAYRYKGETIIPFLRETLRLQVSEPTPYFEILTIQLSPNPVAELDLFRKKFLTVEVKYDPEDALRTDLSNEVLGEKFISYVEEGLDKISDAYHFDRNAFDRGIKAYRDSKYTVSFKIVKGKFPGTKVSYEVYGEMGPAHSAAEIVVNPGKETEKIVEFWRANKPTMLGATGYKSIELHDDHVQISHGTWRVFEPVKIARSKLEI